MLPLTPDTDLDLDPTTGLRERKKRLVREAIVDAALDLFSENGYDATTVQAVAERAQVSAATVARYFPTKESMLFSEREVRASQLRDAILARPTSEPPLRAVIRALADQPTLGAADSARLRRCRQAIARSTVLRGSAFALLDQWRDAIAGAVAEHYGLDADDARVLAAAVVAVLDDVAARWAERGATEDVADAVARALAVLDPSGRSSP